jgi:hypothetical protein
MATSGTTPTIRLFDRNDGTFLKPSPSATAEHCIRFWNTVEIPDEIITQVEGEYRKVRAQEIDTEMESAMAEWRAKWEAENPPPAKDKHLPEYQDRFRREYEEYRQSILPTVETKRPPALGEYDSRQLIRASRMAIHRPNERRFPGEGDKVLDEPVELFEETLTVWEIEQKYKISAVGYAMSRIFRNHEEAILAALEGARDQLHGIHEQLIHLRSDLSD